jgi:riboflavin biosynthesis pyrimidine reductase
VRWIYGGGGEVDVAAAYAWPDGQPWVRAMMVMSLDGAIAGPDGKSGSISNATDRSIMSEVRRGADVVLIGAGTMRAERYSPLRGRPTLAMVSASLDLPWDEPAFRESDHRPIVITTTSAPEAQRKLAHAHADVVELEVLDGASIVNALFDLRLHRIVCEGGAQLLGALAGAGVMDEYDVAVSPQFLLAGQVLLDAALAMPQRVELIHAIEDEGFVFTKFQTAEPAA